MYKQFLLLFMLLISTTFGDIAAIAKNLILEQDSLPSSIFPPSGWRSIDNSVFLKPKITIKALEKGLISGDKNIDFSTVISDILRSNTVRPIEILIPEGVFFLKTPLIINESGVYIKGIHEQKSKVELSIPTKVLKSGESSIPAAISFTGSISDETFNVKSPPVYSTNTITLHSSDIDKFEINDYIAIYASTSCGDTNNINWYVLDQKFSKYTKREIRKQIFQIIDIKGTELILDMKHGVEYGNIPSEIKIEKILPIRNVGLEGLKFEWPFCYPDSKVWSNNVTYNIKFNAVTNGYLRNIVSTESHMAHLYMSYTKNSLIENCIFREIEELNYSLDSSSSDPSDEELMKRAVYGTPYKYNDTITKNGVTRIDTILVEASAKGYGIKLELGSTGNLITNNFLYNLRHAITLTDGANHNILSYNHISLGRGTANSICIHGNFPHNNLIESNILPDGASDWVHSPNGPRNTWYRNNTVSNYSKSELSATYLGAARGDYGGHNLFNYKQSIIANVLGKTANDAGDAFISSNVFLKGNTEYNKYYQILNINITYQGGAIEHILPASLYLDKKPAFLSATSPWPLFGPDVMNNGITNTLPSLNYKININQ